MNKAFFAFCLLISMNLPGKCQNPSIVHDEVRKAVAFGNNKMHFRLEYGDGVNISEFSINGRELIKGGPGIYSKFSVNGAAHSTLHLLKTPVVTIKGSSITVHNIRYGNDNYWIDETWNFRIDSNDVVFEMQRKMPSSGNLEQVGFPSFIFNSVNTWEGAFQDYGGIAWFYLFNKKQDTYGVHSRSSKFWNSKTGDGLTLSVDAADKNVAMSYSRNVKDQLDFSIGIADHEAVPRFDSGTHRRRYLRDTTNVWAPFTLEAGVSKQIIRFSYFNFNQDFDRGNFIGIDETKVAAVLNTIARIGIIDKQHFGGNSWHTPYGPICLHEQYIAQLGLAINDNAFLRGYQQCLDYYRDNAVRTDGRVWSRWAYTNEDAMPQKFTEKGFYEAQWGYLMDSNPDLVINVSELYHQTGDLQWVKTHQSSCEKILKWIMDRDSDDNGLVEMFTNSYKEKKGSDWIDIIWAAYENAFVNAKLYHALILWADIERQLGDTKKESYYKAFAEKLKTNFNKPITEGGFWDQENGCYVHWRDKDGSIHGRNMVTPVNFMAIGYGICEDESRKKIILDTIEEQMQKEDLFFWPLCMTSYAPGEGNDWQFPFPNYENGDIFLSWGALGVKVYAAYKPELALKYVKKVLERYSKDGLAYQRYGRLKQDGRGDDILSGNSLSVIGLYQAIFGVNPMYNRFYLNPHLTEEVSGTQLKYRFRDQLLTIDLSMGEYKVSNGQFSISAGKDFGFSAGSNNLMYFDGANEKASLKALTPRKNKLSIAVGKWSGEVCEWTQLSGSTPFKVKYELSDLNKSQHYKLSVNGRVRNVKTDSEGGIVFETDVTHNAQQVKLIRD